jgi:hypothetical protein
VDGSHYDAIFTAIRRFAEKLLASQKWLDRAEETRDPTWRLSFVREARRAFEDTRPHLAELHRRIGPVEGLEPVTEAEREALLPSEALEHHLVAMQKNYDAQEERLRAAESQLTAIGTALRSPGRAGGIPRCIAVRSPAPNVESMAERRLDSVRSPAPNVVARRAL